MLLTRKSEGRAEALNPLARAASTLAAKTVDRRAFLKGAAMGAGVVAGVGFVPQSRAETHGQHDDVSATAQAHAHGGEQGAFFNHDDAATISAFNERLMPGEPGKPGARDAGVLNYIDLALAGAYADLQDFYRGGLAALDAYCRETYKKAFAQLDTAQQDAVILTGSIQF